MGGYSSESEMEFSNAIKLNPNNAQIYHEFAKFCERHRQPPDYKKATDLYFKACQTDPIHFLSAAVDAANLMRRLDTKPSRKSAMALFEKLVVDAPHLNDAYLGFAKLLLREKQYDRANRVLLEGLRHHPHDHDLKSYYAHYQQTMSRPSMMKKAMRPSVLYQPSGLKSEDSSNMLSTPSASSAITTNNLTTSPLTNSRSEPRDYSRGSKRMLSV